MKYLHSFGLVLPFLLSNCQSPEDQRLGGGVATAGALALAVPLVPVAGAYHLLSGTAAKERAEEGQRAAQQEPIWQQRCRDLAARDPQRDAREAFFSGRIAFLLLRLDAPGVRIGNADYRMKNLQQNAGAIHSSVLLRHLMELSSPYSAVQSDDWAWTDSFKRYIHASGDYRAAFNKEMYQRVKRGQPDHPLLPVPLNVR